MTFDVGSFDVGVDGSELGVVALVGEVEVIIPARSDFCNVTECRGVEVAELTKEPLPGLLVPPISEFFSICSTVSNSASITPAVEDLVEFSAVIVFPSAEFTERFGERN